MGRVALLLLALPTAAAHAAGDGIPAPRPVPRRLQVLLIDGVPRWENRCTRALLERTPLGRGKAFGYRHLLLGADADNPVPEPRSLRALPARGELDHFHLVILGDVDPADRRVGEEHLKNLARYVRDGGGLLVVAGPHHTPHAFKGTALAGVLPVELGDRPPAKKEDLRTQGYRPALTAAGRAHPAFRFDPDPDACQKVWDELPEMYWFAEGCRARSGTEILATHPTATEKGAPLPLVVWHTVGKGRCGFVGFDETWRWRRNEGHAHHQAFWVGLWRSLAVE